MFWRERWLLCALVLLGFIAGGRSELQYVLSSSASLLSGEMGKACVIIVGNKEKLDVSLKLQHDGKNTTIIGEDVSSPSYFQCADYKIPSVSNAVPVALLLFAKGPGTEILERKTLVIQPNKNNCLYQMDKPIYQPEQTVRLRICCLDSQLKAVKEKFPTIYLMDPSGTRIKQWRNQETQRGLLSLEFLLIKDAPVGSYSIIAERASSYSLSQWFTVEEYVPPRFSVTVDAPDTISALQQAMEFSVSGMYVYGDPVPGQVTVLYCKQSNLYGRRRNCLREKADVCSNMTGELSPEGVYKGVIDLSGCSMGLTGMSLQLQIIVSEAGTGIQVPVSRYVWVSTQPARLSFDYGAMKPHYKRCIDYPVMAQLVDEQNKPIPNQDIEIQLDQTLIQTVKTDSDGKIAYRIDTCNMVAPNFTVQISYQNPDQCYYAEWRDTDYPTAEYTAFRFYSRTGSFIEAKRILDELKCGQSKNIEVQYTMSRDGVGEKGTSVRLYYLVMAKSKIIQAGHQDADLTSSMNGSVNIPLSVSADIAPNANLIVFSILKGEIVVEKVELNIEKCFKNKVDMAFSEERGMPGATAEVILSADPESICGIKVIDSSLLLLNSYDPFSPDSIHGLFSYWFYGYNIAGFNVEDPEPPCLDPNKLVFFKGNYYLPVSSDSDGDSYQNLMEAGLIFATKDQVRKPKVCDYRQREQSKHVLHTNGAVPEVSSSLKVADSRGFGRGESAVETIRTNFAETFMWLLVPLDKDGHASLSEIVPDTITKWQGTTFCLSDKGGFGMTKYPANYTTYLPFFVELTKPYSCMRGETLVLVAVVHNNLEQFVKVQVTLEPSNAFTAQLKEGTQDACVGPKSRAPYTWEIQPNDLGRVNFTVTAQTTFIGKSCDGPNDASQPTRKDTVVQNILVEPEGISQQLTLSNLVFVKPGANAILPVRITPPKNVVKDSVSAYIVAVGDVFGLPLKNLQDLVQKPYGCCEQNLARVAPIIYVLDYLNNTGQLTPEILEKGKQYIMEGYYRHQGYASGAAYRVFRSSPQPNSWLTMYSFQVFEEAKRYVEIDESRQQQTFIWLENQQRLDNGCFDPQGTLFAFQDTNRPLHYTAFITIVLLKSKYSLGKTMLDGALECLKNASKTKQKIADEVLMLYAFTLAGLAEYRDPLMAKLMKKAIVKDGTMHWQREDMPALRPVPFFLPTYSSAEVQISSYMLLSVIHANVKPTTPAAGSKKPKIPAEPPVSEKALGTMSQISLYLTQQMNPSGGFPSTTDTAVALQALAAFAKLLYTPNSQQTIRIKKSNGNIGSLNVGRESRLVVQRFDLPDPSGDYSLEVEGTGWGLVQTVFKCNIQIPKENSAYALSLSTASNTCLNGVTKTFNITVNLSYRGNGPNSGMTMMKIRMLSGYSPDYWSLRALEEDKVISRSEDDLRGNLLIYLESEIKEPISFTFRVFMSARVLNVKTSSAVVYDYYQQDYNGYAPYDHPCGKQN